MKRSGPLERRTRLSPVSRKRRTRLRDYSKSRSWVLDRARGRCEFAHPARCVLVAEQVHHIKPRSRGGTDDLGNLLAICGAHHRWIHANPAEATALGYLSNGRNGREHAPADVVVRRLENTL